MQEFTPLDGLERELEHSLESLRPERGAMREQAIWYRAGLLTARRRVQFWRGVAAAVIVLGSGIALLRPVPKPVTIDHYVYLANSPADLSVAQTSGEVPIVPSYLVLRNAVETSGWRATSTPQAEGSHDAPKSVTPWPIDPSLERTPNRG